nr:MAG TPA: Replication associated protein [Microviridae sp.]
MCLYPIYGNNPKFKPNKTNGGVPPVCTDKRLLIVPFKCGKCIECRKQKQREWSIRLNEWIREKDAYFITATFSEESLAGLQKESGLKWEENANDIATLALRRCLERIRKNTRKSIKHWFITELGDEKGRIHLHGIICGKEDLKNFYENWKYGFVDIGKWCNGQTINYICKYMLKVNIKYPNFQGKVLCSKGIGSEYFKRNTNEWQKENYKTIEVPTYKFRNGSKVAMPKYYKDRVFNEEQREKMWTNNLERGIEWIGGEKVKAEDIKTIEKLRKWYRKRGQELFFDDPVKWDEQKQIKKMEKQRKHIADNRKRLNRGNAKGVSAGQGKQVKNIKTKY